MANLGAEVSRFFGALQKDDRQKAIAAKDRALKMIVEIEQFPEMKARKNEVEKINLILKDSLEDKKLAISAKDLERYFMPFSLRLLA